MEETAAAATEAETALNTFTSVTLWAAELVGSVVVTAGKVIRSVNVLE